MSRYVFTIEVDSPHDEKRTRELLTRIINAGVQDAIDSANDSCDDDRHDALDACDLAIETPL